MEVSSSDDLNLGQVFTIAGLKKTSNNHYIFGTFWPFINCLGDPLTKDSSLGPLDFEEPQRKGNKNI